MTIAARHTEGAFESVIESHLLANGYVSVDKAAYDPERAVFPDVVGAFTPRSSPTTRRGVDLQPRTWHCPGSLCLSG